MVMVLTLSKRSLDHESTDSILFSLHFVGPDGKENLFTSLVGDQFLHPCDLNV